MIELLVAIPIGMMVIGIGSYMYLKSVSQFQNRVEESDLFRTLYLVNKNIELNLQQEVSYCTFGKLKVIIDGDEFDLSSHLKANFKNLQKVEFECFEMDVITQKLVKWKNAPKPVLIEYTGELKDKGISRTILGSVLK